MSNPPPSGGNRQQWQQDTGVHEAPYDPTNYTNDQAQMQSTFHSEANQRMSELGPPGGGPFGAGDGLTTGAAIGVGAAGKGAVGAAGAFTGPGIAHSELPQAGLLAGQQQLHHTVSHTLPSRRWTRKDVNGDHPSHSSVKQAMYKTTALASPVSRIKRIPRTPSTIMK
jgi:hypothetical protein